MKDVWMTFSKARLNCSLPGEFPFYYDEIQGAVYHPEERIVYATFTTPMYVKNIDIFFFKQKIKRQDERKKIKNLINETLFYVCS